MACESFVTFAMNVSSGSVSGVSAKVACRSSRGAVPFESSTPAINAFCSWSKRSRDTWKPHAGSPATAPNLNAATKARKTVG